MNEGMQGGRIPDFDNAKMPSAGAMRLEKSLARLQSP